MSLVLFEKDRINGCPIAVATTASEPERFAAEELQRYLEAATAGTFLITESAATGFVIGALGRSITNAPDLSEDCYMIRRVGDQILIFGGSPRATLYAVYHFLERYLGFRWLEPGDDAIPTLSKIELGNIDDIEEPVYVMRSILNFPYTPEQMVKEVDWMAKVRLNWAHPAPNDPNKWQNSRPYETVMPEVTKRGLKMLWGGHTFHTWIPNDKYLETHPEFFAVVNGERGSQANFKGSLCLSNPDLPLEVANNMLRFAEDNPGIEALDLWINDTADWCECEKCAKMEGKTDYVDYSDVFCPESGEMKSRAYFAFVNKVAGLVRARNPNLSISPLAYFRTYEPPRELKLEPNVLLGHTNFVRTWQTLLMSDEHPCNIATDATIRKWRKITENVFIYEYYGCPAMFNSFTAALTNLEVMSEEMKYYPTIGINLISTEAGADEYWRPLILYAYARLAWNPDESWEAILEDFCRNAYGDIAEQMIEFWRYQESREPFVTRKQKNEETLRWLKAMTSDEKVAARLSRLEMLLSQPDPHPEWPENQQ